MTKPILPHWQLQALVRMEVEKHASDALIVAVVQPDGDAAWDEGCEGVGRTAWRCGFLLPKEPPTLAIMTRLREAIAPLQLRYDLGVTAD